MSLNVIYGKLKTYELEQDYRAIIYRIGSVNNISLALAKTTALVAHLPETSEVKVTSPKAGKEIIEAEIDELILMLIIVNITPRKNLSN